MIPRLAHVESWIFDLDNSLYPASTDLFALIDVRMGLFIQQLLGCGPEEARRVQKGHFLEHGTTLAGLMREHRVDPHEFLDFVHDIDLARLTADPALVAALDRLPGRKFVFTNADEGHARRDPDGPARCRPPATGHAWSSSSSGRRLRMAYPAACARLSRPSLARMLDT